MSEHDARDPHAQDAHAPKPDAHGGHHDAGAHGKGPGGGAHGAQAHGGGGHGGGAHGAEGHGEGEHGEGGHDEHGGGHGGHHKSHEHDHGPGTPPWLISFGDMMTLFLCFFIMLVTMAKTQDAGLMAKGLGPFIASLEMSGNDGALGGSRMLEGINRYRIRFGLEPLTEAEWETGIETPHDPADID